MVLVDDRVPDCFARTRHAQREIEQAQRLGPVGKVRKNPLVAADPGVAVDIPRRGLAHHGMEQEVRFAGVRGLHRERDLGAVQRVAGLEGDHTPPAELSEALPQLSGSASQRPVIIVQDRLKPEDTTAHVDRMRPMKQAGHPGVSVIGGAVDGARLPRPSRVAMSRPPP